MGMDGVEFVMAVEDAFDIRIEDAEAEKVMTPRQLIELVMSKVAVASATTCLTHRAFNLVRRSILRHCSLTRAQVAPGTHLSALVTKGQRRDFLGKVAAEMGIKNPPVLSRPNWLTALLFGAAVLLGLTAAIFLQPDSAFLVFLTFTCAAVLTGYLGAKLTTSWRTELPTEIRTAGDLSRWVVSHKPDLADNSRKAWTREQVAMRVREISNDVLSCDSKYHEDARFVEDLGLS